MPNFRMWSQSEGLFHLSGQLYYSLSHNHMNERLCSLLLGVNMEMTANLKTSKTGNKAEVINGTRLTRVNTNDGSYTLKMATSTDFCILGNFYISKGQKGQVLEVKASKRTGPQNYPQCIREALAKHYGNKPVGLGGAFLVEQGKVRTHVMSNFSQTPLTTDEEVNEWLCFYEMSGPLVCLGYLVSHDPGLDLRMSHFHCYSEHGDGGHYHNDTTADEVVYKGYFYGAEYLYRLDQPSTYGAIGRD